MTASSEPVEEHSECHTALMRAVEERDRAEERVKVLEEALDSLGKKCDVEHAELCRLGGACSRHQPAAGFIRAALKGAP